MSTRGTDSEGNADRVTSAIEPPGSEGEGRGRQNYQNARAWVLRQRDGENSYDRRCGFRDIWNRRQGNPGRDTGILKQDSIEIDGESQKSHARHPPTRGLEPCWRVSAAPHPVPPLPFPLYHTSRADGDIDHRTERRQVVCRRCGGAAGTRRMVFE
ncbi:hypothetical protein H4582DRAFT_2064440 [Lactarius indigo]|nr:hypothetical protein H4582DRAFT_2064440 [Lactarius indigo]